MEDLDNYSLTHPRHCPTEEEVLSGRISVKNLDYRIQALQKQLGLLQRQRENTASYISPFRCLPVEILEIITRICLDNGVPITTMTQICGRLRDVVTGMAVIWSKIRLSSMHALQLRDYIIIDQVCYHSRFIG
jgi:hypothetical protein